MSLFVPYLGRLFFTLVVLHPMGNTQVKERYTSYPITPPLYHTGEPPMSTRLTGVIYLPVLVFLPKNDKFLVQTDVGPTKDGSPKA